MNISDVKIGLTGEDLLSIIKEFLNIDGLEISDIQLKNEINVTGSFNKGFKIDFIAGIKLVRIENGIIHAEVSSFKLLKIGIVSLIRKLALKYALKVFEEKGIHYEKGKVVINIKKILKDVPYIDFDIKDLYIRNSILNVEVKDINVSIKGTLIKEIEDEKEVLEENTSLMVVSKVKDSYSSGREYAIDKLPEKAKKISDYLFIIPDMVALIYRLLKDRRVPMKTKLIISAAVAYIAFPTDIIPDSIPFIGKVDELAVAFFALDRIISDVPLYIILENWEGKNDIILVIKNMIEYVINFTGARNVEKLYNVLDELVSL